VIAYNDETSLGDSCTDSCKRKALLNQWPGFFAEVLTYAKFAQCSEGQADHERKYLTATLWESLVHAPCYTPALSRGSLTEHATTPAAGHHWPGRRRDGRRADAPHSRAASAPSTPDHAARQSRPARRLARASRQTQSRGRPR